jgi:hypothetical protein
MKHGPVARRLHTSTALERPPSTNRAVIQELQRAIARWAYGHELHTRARSRRQQITEDKAEHLEHLSALRESVNARLPDRERRSCLKYLDRVEAELFSFSRWELVEPERKTDRQRGGRLTPLPPHRPSQHPLRAECQQVMKRHGLGPVDVATIIVKVIVPTLPKAVRASLLGPWRDERQRIQHLADRLRKRV